MTEIIAFCFGVLVGFGSMAVVVALIFRELRADQEPDPQPEAPPPFSAPDIGEPVVLHLVAEPHPNVIPISAALGYRPKRETTH